MIEKGNKEGLWNEDGVKKIMFYVDEDYEDYNNIVFGNIVDELKIDISEYIHQLS